MRYTLIDKDVAILNDFRSETHRIVGGMMILNENELRSRQQDIEALAEALGGTLMTYGETVNKIKEIEYD